MEAKYNNIYAQLKLLSKSTLDNNSTNILIEDFKAIVKERIAEIHKKLDAKKDLLIQLALQTYSKSIDSAITQEENNKTKIEEVVKIEENEQTSVEINNKAFRDGINGLVNNLDSILLKTQILQETVDAFKDKKFNQIIDIKNDDFVFKHEKKLDFRLKGKSPFELGWDTTQNKPTNSNIDPDDSSKLIVHANSCYNYYATNKQISDEIVQVMFATNINKNDTFFYFGVSDESNAYNSNCMCCAPKCVTYIKSNGSVVVNGILTTNSELNFEQGENITVTIRVDAKEKQVFFKIDEKNEQGPFELPSTGSKYTIVSGSCNTANGFISILSSQVIG